jgi:Predicted membrane protein
MLCPQSRSALPEADIFDLQMIFASAASARLIERNRPSMFAHPVWSFQCDVRMLRLWLGGRLHEERAGVEAQTESWQRRFGRRRISLSDVRLKSVADITPMWRVSLLSANRTSLERQRHAHNSTDHCAARSVASSSTVRRLRFEMDFHFLIVPVNGLGGFRVVAERADIQADDQHA